MKDCIVCGCEFIPHEKYPKQKCCSPPCRKKQWAKTLGPAYWIARYAKNPDKAKASARKSVQKAKDACYRAYGGYRCSCCGIQEKAFLTLDHIHNDGAAQRKLIGRGDLFYRWLINHDFPPIVQVMCFNCNCGRRINGGTCPHKDVQNGS